jgi:hypothetical protein
VPNAGSSLKTAGVNQESSKTKRSVALHLSVRVCSRVAVVAQRAQRSTQRTLKKKRIELKAEGSIELDVHFKSCTNDDKNF